MQSTPSSSSSLSLLAAAAAAIVVMETTTRTTCNYKGRWRRWRHDETMTTCYYYQAQRLSSSSLVAALAGHQSGRHCRQASSTSHNKYTRRHQTATLPAACTTAGQCLVSNSPWHRVTVWVDKWCCYEIARLQQNSRPADMTVRGAYWTFVRPSVRYQTREHDVMKTNELAKWQVHETISFGGQEVKVQSHTRAKLDLKTWRRHHSQPR